MHEHLDEMGVIHMNGRIYDPLIGRFMSADPTIQAPFNLKSFNRYSYVWNNPLKLVDLNGYDARDTVTGSVIPGDNSTPPTPESNGGSLTTGNSTGVPQPPVVPSGSPPAAGGGSGSPPAQGQPTTPPPTAVQQIPGTNGPVAPPSDRNSNESLLQQVLDNPTVKAILDNLNALGPLAIGVTGPVKAINALSKAEKAAGEAKAVLTTATEGARVVEKSSSEVGALLGWTKNGPNDSITRLVTEVTANVNMTVADVKQLAQEGVSLEKIQAMANKLEKAVENGYTAGNQLLQNRVEQLRKVIANW